MFLRDRAIGSLVGLAIGDALGAPVEFRSRGTYKVSGYQSGGTWNLPAGYWTDDTSMALAMIDGFEDACMKMSAIADHGEASSRQILIDCLFKKWLAWYRDGDYSSVGYCFDIGNRTRKALCEYEAGSVSVDLQARGNGGIMRMAPASIIDAVCNLQIANDGYGVYQALLTHQAQDAHECACRLNHILVSFILGEALEIITPELKPTFTGGLATECFAMALDAFLSTASFDECVLKAVNFGGDTDSIGAVAGQIGGAYYGLEAIKQGNFYDGLFDKERIERYGQKSIDIGSSIAANENFDRNN